MVLKAKDYITAGDIFQVVLAQRFTCPFPLPPVRAPSRAAPGEPVARSSTSSIFPALPWSARAQKSWSASATAR